LFLLKFLLRLQPVFDVVAILAASSLIELKRPLGDVFVWDRIGEWCVKAFCHINLLVLKLQCRTSAVVVCSKVDKKFKSLAESSEHPPN